MVTHNTPPPRHSGAVLLCLLDSPGNSRRTTRRESCRILLARMQEDRVSEGGEGGRTSPGSNRAPRTGPVEPKAFGPLDSTSTSTAVHEPNGTLPPRSSSPNRPPPTSPLLDLNRHRQRGFGVVRPRVEFDPGPNNS